MNILIYFGNQLSPTNGGTERVACMISEYLKSKGHSITHLCCYASKNKKALPSLFLPDSSETATPNNIKFVKEIIARKKIQLIINEGGNGDAIYLFSHEKIGNKAKIITHLHFDIFGESNVFYKTQYLPIWGVPISKSITNILKRIKLPYNKRLNRANKIKRFSYMLNESDYVIVLSANHVRDYKSLIGVGDFSKVKVLKNPYSFEYQNISVNNKENRILFVGRLDYSSKRVDRILRVWKIIHKKFPDWKLSIVGDGNDREHLQHLSKKLGLTNISFEGQIDSEPFYKKSKILLMTSNYEGVPMVIGEAMAYGVVPIIMDSFAGAHDAISNNFNGILIKPFSISRMASELQKFMLDENALRNISNNAISTIKAQDNYSILSQWDNIINTISSTNE